MQLDEFPLTGMSESFCVFFTILVTPTQRIAASDGVADPARHIKSPDPADLRPRFCLSNPRNGRLYLNFQFKTASAKHTKP